jgi:hypothetical protein
MGLAARDGPWEAADLSGDDEGFPLVAAADENQVKGVAFFGVLEALKDLRGAEVEAAVRAALPGEMGAALRLGTLLTSGWYPISWYRAFYATLVTVNGQGPGVVHELGRRSARRDVTGIYKLVFKVISVQTAFSQASRVARQYFKLGDMIIEPGDHRATARYVGFTGFDANIWTDFAAGGEMVMELAGARDLAWKITSGGGDGDDHMHADMTWR